MNELNKALIKMAANAAEREPLRTKKEMVKSLLMFFFPTLLIVVCAVLSYWFEVSPLWYVGLAIAAGIIYLTAFYVAQVFGQVKGTKYALQNPRNGETSIKIIVDGDEIWESEKFIPAPALPEPVTLEMSASEIKTPDQPAIFMQWMNAWDHVISSWIETKGEKEIRDELARRGYPSSKKTYRLIYLAGKANSLTMREYERKFGKKETRKT